MDRSGHLVCVSIAVVYVHISSGSIFFVRLMIILS
jgi:hypothetical protein